MDDKRGFLISMNIENLSIEIESNSEKAVEGIDELVSTLTTLKSVAQGGILGDVNAEIIEFASNLSSIKALGDIEKSVSKVVQHLKDVKIPELDLTSGMNENTKGVVIQLEEVQAVATDTANSINNIEFPGSEISESIKPVENSIEHLAKRAKDLGYTLKKDMKLSPEFEKLSADARKAGYSLQQAINTPELSSFRNMLVGLSTTAKQVGTAFKASFGFLASTMKRLIPIIKSVSAALARMVGQVIGLGIAFNTANRQAGFFNSTVGKALKSIILYRAIRSLITQIGRGFREGTQNIAQFSSAANAAMSSIITNTQYLKNSLGAMAAPAIQALVPIFDSVTAAIVRATNAIGMFIAALTGAGFFTKAIKVNQDYAKSLGGAAGAAKGLAQELDKVTGIDELNVLNENAGGGGGGGGGGGFDGIGDMFEVVEIPSAISDFAKALKEAFLGQDFEWFYDLGYMLGQKFTDALKMIPWDFIQEWANATVKMVAHFLNGAVDGADWSVIGYTVGQAINTVFGMMHTWYTEFNFANFGKAIAEGINNALYTTDFDLIGKTIAAKFNAVIDFVGNLVKNLDWREVGLSVAQTINSVFSNIKFADAGRAISDAVIGLLTAFTTAVKNTDWSVIGQNIRTLLDNIDWSGVWDAVKDAVSAAWKGFKDLFSELPTWLQWTVGLGAAFSLFGGGIGNVFSAITNLLPSLAMMKGGFAALLVPLAKVIGIVALVVAGITVLAIAVYKNFDEIKESFASVGQGFSDIWNGVLKPIFGVMWEQVKVVFGSIVEFIGSAIAGILKVIGGLLDFVIGVFTGDWGRAWEGIKDTFSGIFDVIVAVAKFVGETLSAIFTVAWEVIKLVWDGVVGFFSGVWDGIVKVFSVVGEWFSEIFTAAKNAVHNAWSNTKDFFSGIWQGTQNVFANVGGFFNDKFNNAWKNITDVFNSEKVAAFFSSARDAVQNIWNTIDGWMGDKFGDAWENIKDAFASVGEFFSGIWETITGIFADAFGWFKDIGKAVVEGLWQGISDMVSWIVDKVKGFGESILGGIKGIFGINSPAAAFIEIATNCMNSLGMGYEDGTGGVLETVKSGASQIIGSFGDMTGDILSNMGEFSSNLIKDSSSTLNSLSKDASKLLPNTSKEFTSTHKDIISDTSKFAKDLTTSSTNMLNTVRSSIQSASPLIINLFKQMYSSIMTETSRFSNELTRSITDTMNTATRTVQNAVPVIVNLFRTMYADIMTETTRWNNSINIEVTSTLNGIISKANSQLPIFVQAFTKAFSDIVAEAVKMKADVESAVTTMTATLNSMNLTAFTNTFTQAFSAVTKAANDMKDAINSAMDAVSQRVGNIQTGLIGTYNTMFSNAETMASRLLSGIRDTVNRAIDTLNALPDNNISKPTVNTTISIPRLRTGHPFIPHDNFAAYLHKGERVLTAAENREYGGNNDETNGLLRALISAVEDLSGRPIEIDNTVSVQVDSKEIAVANQKGIKQQGYPLYPDGHNFALNT